MIWVTQLPLEISMWDLIEARKLASVSIHMGHAQSVNLFVEGCDHDTSMQYLVTNSLYGKKKVNSSNLC